MRNVNQRSNKSAVASASGKQPRKRERAVIDVELVNDYLRRLEAALGDEAKFRPVFTKLGNDAAVGQPEAVELASLFVARTAASTSRAKALERIEKRHANLAMFKLKQRAMQGRSAA